MPQPPTPKSQAMEVCSRLEGAYALLIKSARYPNELVACKQGSPLVYGLKRREAPHAEPDGREQAAAAAAAPVSASHAGNGVEVWLASDSAALLSHTRDVVVSAGRGHCKRRANWGTAAAAAAGVCVGVNVTHPGRTHFAPRCQTPKPPPHPSPLHPLRVPHCRPHSPDAWGR